MRRRCPRLCSLRVESRVAYGRCLRSEIDLVKCRCTLSIRFIWDMYDNDQVVEAYSRIGRTYILNARIKLEVFSDGSCV